MAAPTRRRRSAVAEWCTWAPRFRTSLKTACKEYRNRWKSSTQTRRPAWTVWTCPLASTRGSRSGRTASSSRTWTISVAKFDDSFRSRVSTTVPRCASWICPTRPASRSSFHWTVHICGTQKAITHRCSPAFSDARPALRWVQNEVQTKCRWPDDKRSLAYLAAWSERIKIKLF